MQYYTDDHGHHLDGVDVVENLVRVDNGAQVVNFLKLSINESIAMTKLILEPVPLLDVILLPDLSCRAVLRRRAQTGDVFCFRPQSYANSCHTSLQKNAKNFCLQITHSTL